MRPRGEFVEFGASRRFGLLAGSTPRRAREKNQSRKINQRRLRHVTRILPLDLRQRNRKHRNSTRRQKPRRSYARRLAAEPLEERCLLAVLTVNSIDDTHINTTHAGMLTLREAIEVIDNGSAMGLDSATVSSQISISNGSIGTNDTIQFAAGLSGGTISLTLGQLELSHSATIFGLARTA